MGRHLQLFNANNTMDNFLFSEDADPIETSKEIYFDVIIYETELLIIWFDWCTKHLVHINMSMLIQIIPYVKSEVVSDPLYTKSKDYTDSKKERYIQTA